MYKCGKPSLFELVRQTIESEKVAQRTFAAINCESKNCGIETKDDLYDYVRRRLSLNGRTYIFIDESQRVEGWQLADNAMRVELDCDIYPTEPNAYLLSSELSMYLSGHYMEIKMLPLIISEYLSFCDISFAEKLSTTLDPDSHVLLFDDLFE